MDDKDLERVMKAFSNKRRIAIVRFIKKSREAAVGEIAESIKLSFRATSKHLSVLFGANILEKEQRGLYIFYKVAGDMPQASQKILSLL